MPKKTWYTLNPKDARYSCGEILSQIIIIIPGIETLHSTIQLPWALWEKTLILSLQSFWIPGCGFEHIRGSGLVDKGVRVLGSSVQHPSESLGI